LAAGRLVKRIVNGIPEPSRDGFRRDVPEMIVRQLILGMCVAIGAQIVLDRGGSPEEVGFLYTAPHIGFLLGMLYVPLGRGRSPLRMLFWPEMLSRSLLISVAATPWLVALTGAREPLVLTVAFGTTMALETLGTPFIGAVYGQIYPQSHRGKIVGTVRTIQAAIVAPLLFLLGEWLTDDSSGYQIIHPLIGLCGVVATIYFCAMRLPRTDSPPTPPDAVGASRRASPAPPPSARFKAVRILIRDGNFARFQLFQFMVGFGMLGSGPVIALYVNQKLNLSIAEAALVVNTSVMQQAMMLLTVRAHGAIFDHIGVVRHRVLTSSVMAVGMLVWALSGSFVGALIAAALLAFGRSGGLLVWTVGPLAFASRAQDMGDYAGVHTVLTGLRGVTAPVAATWLITAEASPLAGDFAAVFGLLTGLIAVSALGHAFLVKTPPRFDAGPATD
jgi:hypothetical protein